MVSKTSITLKIPVRFVEDEHPVVEKEEFSTSGRIQLVAEDIPKLLEKEIENNKELDALIYKSLKAFGKKIEQEFRRKK